MIFVLRPKTLIYMNFTHEIPNDLINKTHLFLNLIFILYKMYDTLMKFQTRKNFEIFR